ncbi:unnamed protein product [Fraxinus pennsylvanica]|uniref:Phosphoenolpyruvate carboxylase n=1 Tax=Fraxinus pennsylvanica TaxID=56036 RepID=A0AAD2A7D6_9LAMI|nr:unnamed protein product [Fraxinus pennsylvanica]
MLTDYLYVEEEYMDEIKEENMDEIKDLLFQLLLMLEEIKEENNVNEVLCSVILCNKNYLQAQGILQNSSVSSGLVSFWLRLCGTFSKGSVFWDSVPGILQNSSVSSGSVSFWLRLCGTFLRALCSGIQSLHDPKKELGNVLDPGDSVVVAKAFSHMLNLANLAVEVQIAYLQQNKKKKSDCIDENSITTESDIEEIIKRLVVDLKMSPQEVFNALKNQTEDLVFTAHPTQFVQRSLLH